MSPKSKGKSAAKKNRKEQTAHLVMGQVMREWRLSQGLPLKTVAKDLKVSISVVSQWERAHRFPSMQNLLAISDYINIPVSRLFCTRKDCPYNK